MRRSRVEISIDILMASMEGANKTKVVYDAYLNFKQAEEYLSFLIDAGLLTQWEIGGKVTYQTTEKGEKMLNRYKELTEKVEL